jgi:hypothetical protein
MSDEQTITASTDETAPLSTTTDGPAPPTVARPRLNLSSASSRKGGKSMFGLVLGTLNKAKIEEKQRDASEAVKKRQMIEKRLQAKLRNETEEVRKAEESKKDKTLATRKEEELGVRLSVYKLRRVRFPLLSNFLLTSDVISDDSTMDTEAKTQDEPQSEAQITAKILSKASAQRSQPPPLYYLPKILLPAQEAFLRKRKEEVTSAAATEWSLFAAERDAGVKEIQLLRQKVLAAQSKSEIDAGGDADAEMNVDGDGSGEGRNAGNGVEETKGADGAMDIDTKPTQPENEGDDAVEY